MRAALACGTLVLAAAASVPSWPTQEPFWPTYPQRKVQVLNGTWSFGMMPGVDPVTIPYSQMQTPNTTQVPSCFDIAPPGVLGPRGPIAFYRSVHNCTPGMQSIIKFYAVNFYARVLIDGAEAGNHTAGGYTPFQIGPHTCSAAGQRELMVVVANTQNNTLNPTNTNGDFYFYSGIIRPVVVTELATTYPYWLQRVEPISTDYVKGLIDIRVVLGGNYGNTSSIHLAYSFNDAPLGAQQAYPLVDGTAIISSVPVPDFKLWTVGQGNTFVLTVQEPAAGDTLRVRSGLRVLGIDQQTARITINGEIVKLLGVNRHTMYPDTGAAVTHAQEAADMALIKGLNANYVRGAHYPQSQSWLDLCDENGVAMWEETLGPGVQLSNIQDPWFMANHLAAVTSMVQTSIAHPAVLFHGFFNEGPSNNPAACPGYAASAATIKAAVGTPPARLVTWASNQCTNDQCFAYADVASFNSYPGWYSNPLNLTYTAEYWGPQGDWMSAHYPDKPWMVSETGGGGVWEWRNDTAPYPGVFWSQMYQKNLVMTDATVLANNSRLSGLTLWQFADIKANDGATTQCGQCNYLPHPNNLTVPWDCAYINTNCGRPGGENHKGQVDFWRRQKESYAPLSQLFGANTALDGVTQRR